MSIERAIEQTLSHELGREITVAGLRRVGGGSINEAAVVHTSDGEYFAKWNHRPIPDQFEREAEGLEALRASGSSLVVPAPIAHRRPQPQQAAPAFLVLTYLEPGRRGPGFDEALGRGLAESSTAPAPPALASPTTTTAARRRSPTLVRTIGSPSTGSIGCAFRWSWPPRSGAGRASIVAILDLLLERLGELLAAGLEPPALIHGDLWSGNLHVAPEGTPAILIRPPTTPTARRSWG